MNPRTRFHWNAGDKGHLCHQQRCKQPATANRLCADHLAWWTTQEACQPPMPDYEKKELGLRQQMRAERERAVAELKRVASLPMRTLDDAAAMHEDAKDFDECQRMLRETEHESLRPLIEQAREIKKSVQQTIAAYRDCAALARLRLQEFDHLHDFETGKDQRTPQSHSGIPGSNVRQLTPTVHVRRSK